MYGLSIERPMDNRYSYELTYIILFLAFRIQHVYHFELTDFLCVFKNWNIVVNLSELQVWWLFSFLGFSKLFQLLLFVSCCWLVYLPGCFGVGAPLVVVCLIYKIIDLVVNKKTETTTKKQKNKKENSQTNKQNKTKTIHTFGTIHSIPLEILNKWDLKGMVQCSFSPVLVGLHFTEAVTKEVPPYLLNIGTVIYRPLNSTDVLLSP